MTAATSSRALPAPSAPARVGGDPERRSVLRVIPPEYHQTSTPRALNVREAPQRSRTLFRRLPASDGGTYELNTPYEVPVCALHVRLPFKLREAA
jgi:hypothetical protein